MTSIILYGGVRIPAEEGPSHSKIFPPDQADRIVKAFRERSEGGWLEYQRDPEKAAQRIARVRRKARGRRNKRWARVGAVQCKEGIKVRGGPRG